MTTLTALKTTINEAIENTNLEAKKLQGRKIQNSERAKVTAACLAIAQQHHNSILVLLSNNSPLHATAFSLLRVFLEATIRGLWLAKIATDDQINLLKINSLEFPYFKTMFKELGEASNSKKNHQTINNAWSMLCSYTHTGEYQIQHWMNNLDIEPNYSEDQILELIKQTQNIANLTYAAIHSILD